MADLARRFPFVWATWIAGLLSADKHCKFAAWYKAHFEFGKRPEAPERVGQLAKWKSEHGDMVAQRVEQLKAEGWRTYVEGQNKFTVRGRTATLMGGPDVVAVRDVKVEGNGRAVALSGDLLLPQEPDEDNIVREALVVDEKTGQRRDSDYWQVLTYMTFLPSAHDAVKGRSLSGAVSYRDGVLPVAPSACDEPVRERIYVLLREVGGPDPLPATPSGGECGWCDIASCPYRVAEAAPVETEAF